MVYRSVAIAFALVLLVAGAQKSLAGAEGTSDPDAVRIVTSDIPRFWAAYDAAQTSADPAKTYETLYFNPGTAGVRGFTAHRLVSPAHLYQTVKKFDVYYAATRPYMTQIPSETGTILADLRRFKQAYSGAMFPDIYFVVGAMNSAGTSVDGVGLILGAEMISRPPDMKVAMSDSYLHVLTGIDRIAPTVAHELTHFNQRDVDQTTLLDSTVYEGTADFMSQLVDGNNAVPEQWSFGCAHEDALWQAFQRDMSSKDTKVITPWLFSYDPGPLQAPPFIGYWLGSRIVQTYYDSQADKTVAVNAILHISDFNAFLKTSGYPEHRAPCAPEERIKSVASRL